MDLNLLATFVLLVGLEVVLGIDNILLISILTDRLPPETRNKARISGLTLALVARLILLMGAAYLLKLSEPAVGRFSYKDLILLAGGAFLIYKAVKEIHHVVEGDMTGGGANKVHATFNAVIGQIVMLDLVFSIDSVITAVGLTDVLWIIYAAVIASFALVLAFSQKIASYVQARPSLKILALSFLVTIGVTLCIEGFGGHVPKSYIYLPMGFALVVELLQMRQSSNEKKTKK
jgi:predicted tellurium resistance membrane protein TerC